MQQGFSTEMLTEIAETSHGYWSCYEPNFVEHVSVNKTDSYVRLFINRRGEFLI